MAQLTISWTVVRAGDSANVVEEAFECGSEPVSTMLVPQKRIIALTRLPSLLQTDEL